jgi:hypothetical protein
MFTLNKERTNVVDVVFRVYLVSILPSYLLVVGSNQ